MTTDFSVQPPADIEAEQCALASMMICGDVKLFNEIRRIIARRESFYQADHSIIFQVLCDIDDAGGNVDSVVLKNELDRRNLLAEVGGTPYLAQLLNTVPSAAHGPHYASIVREKATLRGCIRVANDLIRKCYEPCRYPRAVELAQNALRDLSSLAVNGTDDKVFTIGAAVEEVYERLAQRKAPRIATGLCDFDDICGGLPIGKFTLIGGRPSMGKSQLIKQFARNIAGRGIPFGIVTVEESHTKIGENCLSAMSGIENSHIAFGSLCREEFAELAAAVSKLHKLPLFIMDEPVKLAEVEAAITLLALEHGCRAIAVDYLQLIDGDNPNENREITLISRAIKRTFKRLNVAGCAAVQLNRGNEIHGIRPPTLRDLRGSGSLEQDGDLIALLHREDYYRRGEENYHPDHKLEAIIAKQKDGPTGAIPLWFEGKTQTVGNWNGGLGTSTQLGGAA